MAYRASYGADAYGTELYGVTGAIDGSTEVVFRPSYGKETYGTSTYGSQGNETCNLSVTCSGQVIRDGAAAIASTLSVSVVDPDTVNDASATITLQSATVSVAEEYVASDGFRPGYGLKTYGTSIYGRNDSIEQSTATIAIAATMTVGVSPQFNAQATIAPSLTTTASAVFSVTASAALTSSLSLSTSAKRVLLGTSTSSIALSLATTAIEKWEPIAGTPETWTPVSDVTDTWTPVAATSETWTEITWSRAA